MGKQKESLNLIKLFSGYYISEKIEQRRLVMGKGVRSNGYLTSSPSKRSVKL